jgi:nucleoid-associated protein Lsr2
MKGRAVAKQTTVQLIDDLDGRTADETVRFALDGTNYEIDLSKRNANKLHSEIQAYIDYARAVRNTSNGRRRGRRSSGTFNEVDTKAVRAWAASNRIEVSARGRISATVIDQYRAAGN